ncbi:MAG: zonular occludens toxin domain-containing protein [Sideroxyarcus sp.]|nr:zonular occludens toxin domain-containing protein [Sideroxyarcus sp.]
MINLLLGRPGGGKSYEAVAYHVLPALQQGRKVITNLPLDLAAFSRIDASFLRLIDLRQQTVIVDKTVVTINESGHKVSRIERTVVRPFSSMKDYSDPWRHPVSGAGPLYVIDECHLSLPRGATDIAVEEWFSLHRHETADVLLIAQSYGKVSRNIVEMVQTCYKVSKNVALGFSSSYTRKVLDGVRGEEVNASVRKYDKQFFALYKSHTKGGAVSKLRLTFVRFGNTGHFTVLA